jgi:hypothetical protein
MIRSWLVALSILVVGCGGGTAPTASTTAPASIPPKEPATADEVMEASLVAQGGRDALAKVTSMRQSGTVQVVEMGAKGTMAVVAAPERDMVMTLEIPGIGKSVHGVKGDLVWEIDPMTGSRIVTGKERAATLREATFNSDLVWKQLYPKAELAGIVEFAGTQAYKVVLTASDGDTVTRYFAKDTKLPIGIDKIAETQMGKVPSSTTLSDYREVAGIKYPHAMAMKTGPITIKIAVDKIEPNVALAPSTFEVPDAIKALSNKK